MLSLLLCALTAGALAASAPPMPALEAPALQAGDYLVQSTSAAEAARLVQAAGGVVERRLAIINAVSARLPATALARLRAMPAARLYADLGVRSAFERASPPSGSENDTSGYLLYPSGAVGAAPLHAVSVPTRTDTCAAGQLTPGGSYTNAPLQGWGVTVAAIDSGFINLQNRQGSQSGWDSYDPATGTLSIFGDSSSGMSRCIVYRDFLPRSTANGNQGPQDGRNSTDQNGHGTHVVSSIADNRVAPLGPGESGSVGVAPKVNLVIARALDRNGAGTYAGVIDAIQWVLDNKARYNIRVLNLSIYAPAVGPYWADPLNQAVMRAWQSGLVVVVAAGNSGPEAGTITAPGNVPYVLTVGAVRSGRYTASGADELAPYSSRGPTESGFVKPDVIVPASRTIAPVPDASTSALTIPEARIQEKADVSFGLGAPSKKHTYYRLSGTSMAAAQVSGIVALMLQANPAMTNEQVKYRLLATARAALDEGGSPLYSVWEQGAGLVDTRQAVLCDGAPSGACELGDANAGMSVAGDLNTDTHYWGYTEWAEPPGEFQLRGVNGELLAVWDGAGRAWAGAGRAWAGAGRAWAGAGRAWAGAGRAWAGNWVEEWVAGTASDSRDSLWAGAGRAWAGSAPVSDTELAASDAEMLVSDKYDPPLYEVAITTVQR